GVDWYNYWSANPLSGWLFNNILSQPFASGSVESGTEAAFAPTKVPDGWLEKSEVSLAARPGSLQANGEDLVAAKREVIGQQDRYPQLEILVGDHDDVVSPTIHALKLAEKLPNVRLDVVQGAGHLPHEAAPDRFKKLFDWVETSK
ncbi:MAG: alpha/beta hydrolase, partial [Hyphomonadaceae bacterium]